MQRLIKKRSQGHGRVPLYISWSSAALKFPLVFCRAGTRTLKHSHGFPGKTLEALPSPSSLKYFKWNSHSIIHNFHLTLKTPRGGIFIPAGPPARLLRHGHYSSNLCVSNATRASFAANLIISGQRIKDSG